MRAAVFEGKEQLVVKDVPKPTVADGEILLKIEACCLCGADLRTYRHGNGKITPPRILGHEFCGTVAESKAPDASVGVGDRVVMYIVMPCGKCRYCAMGKANLCENRSTMSYQHDGAFAEYMKVPAAAVAGENLFKVEADVSPVQMALSEPLGCVINAHGRLNIGIKDTVAVVGAGPIGVLHAALARVEGAQRVFLLDTMEHRLDKAAPFGFDELITVTKEGGHRNKIMELTGGIGCDVVIVACSSAQAQADALEFAAKAGRVEFFGGLPKSNPSAELNTNHLHYKEISISGSFSEKKSDFQAAQALVQKGPFPVDRIITHVLPLERVTEGFELMEKGESLKVCVDPWK